MAMKMIPTEKASDEQIRSFCVVSGIEGCETMDRDELIEALRLAAYPTHVVYADDDPPARPINHDGAGWHQQPTEFDPKNERWVICRIAPDHQAEEVDKPVYLSIQNDDENDTIHALVGEDICIRERFYCLLLNCVEERRRQAPEGKDGLPSKFSKAEKYKESRYATTFIRYAGRVKDGPPTDLPEGVYPYTSKAGDVS